MKEFFVGMSPTLILVVHFITMLTSPVLAQSWSQGAAMPTARSEITATNIGNDIYVIGGFVGSGDASDVVEVYNVKNNSWKSVASLPQALHHSAVASHDGKIYLVGGFISRERIPTNQLFIYDPIKNQWTEGNSMPTPRGALNALFVNGTLYAIGGQDGDTILNINEAYDPLGDTWIPKAPMLTARHHAASTAVDNKIYVTGGRIGEWAPSVNVNVNEMYDTEKDKWRQIESMPSKRSGIAAAAINNGLFVFGGENLTRTFGNNEKYDIENGKWTSQESMPTSRHGLAAISIGNKIYVIGGGPEAGLSVSNVNEIYDETALNSNIANKSNSLNSNAGTIVTSVYQWK